MKEGVFHAKEIEAAVLGICLLEKDAIGRVFGTLTPEIFYIEDNQRVYATLREMYENSAPIDLLTVWQRMESAGVKLMGGEILFYLTDLTRNVVRSTHLEYHAELLKSMWRKRELDRLTHAGINPMEDERKQAYALNEQINKLLSGEVKEDWQSMEQLMFNLMVHQDDVKEGKKTFVTTGFRGIDKMNGGFSAGQMIVIGARPSVGKSALMNKIAMSVAKQGKTVGIISLEMNNNEIAARLASIETDTSFGVIYRNLFDDEDQHQIFYERLSKSSNLPVYVSDKTKVDITEIKSKAVKLKHKHGLSMLIMDYLQLVETGAGNKQYNREQEVAKISRGLKLLAMELEIPVIVLCQLNRAVTNRKNKDRYPQLSDLRESGAIEQDADVVMMLHRDWMSGYEVHPDTGNSTEFDADLLGVKWRNGAQFHLELGFEPQLMRFSERAQQLIPAHIPNHYNDDNPF